MFTTEIRFSSVWTQSTPPVFTIRRRRIPWRIRGDTGLYVGSVPSTSFTSRPEQASAGRRRPIELDVRRFAVLLVQIDRAALGHRNHLALCVDTGSRAGPVEIRIYRFARPSSVPAGGAVSIAEPSGTSVAFDLLDDGVCAWPFATAAMASSRVMPATSGTVLDSV